MCYIFLEAWIPVAVRKEIITYATIKITPFCLHTVLWNFYSYSLGYYFYNLAVFCKTVAYFQESVSVFFCCPSSLGNCLRDEMQKAQSRMTNAVFILTRWHFNSIKNEIWTLLQIINPRWIVVLNMRDKTIHTLEDNIEWYFHHLEIGKDFLNTIEKTLV